MSRHVENRRWFWPVLGLVTLLAAAPAAVQGDHLLRCHRCGKNCQPHRLVEKTVMVPKTVVELRGKNCIVTKEEEREEKYTVFVMKPDKRAYKKECWYLDDEVKEQKIKKIEPKLVSVPVHRTDHIKIPETVCTETTRCHEQCTKCGPVCVCETCPVEKTYLHDGISESDYCEKQLVIDQTECTIFYCVKTPKSHKIPCAEEDFFNLVPEERTRKVTVCVPKVERTTVEVEVTKLVPCKVLVCETCCGH